MSFKETINLIPDGSESEESDNESLKENNYKSEEEEPQYENIFSGEIFDDYNYKEKNNDNIIRLRDEINTVKNDYYKLKMEKDNEINLLKKDNEQLIMKKDNEIKTIENEIQKLSDGYGVRFEHEKKLMEKQNEIDTLEKNNEENNKSKIDMNMIKSKCDVYYNLFIRLYDKLTITKKRLDLYQTYLKRINSAIQLSVITLSIGSSFIQALESTNYEILFTTDSGYNVTEYTNYETEIDNSTYSSTVGIITLSISTYSALVIAAERHFSFQQRETNVEKLKESYAEPINRIKTNLELIRPWRYKSYYMKTDSDKKNTEITNKLVIDDDRKKKWISMIDKLDSEYTHIVDVKKELDTSLDKLISIKTIKSYQQHVPRKKRDIKEENITDMEKHSNSNNFMYNWWFNCFLNCWKCRCRQVNHTYDEEDLNHIEDREEIDKINVTHETELNKL